VGDFNKKNLQTLEIKGMKIPREYYILREEAVILASHFWGEVDMEDFTLTFSDSSYVSQWARKDMEKLVKLELLDGYPDNTIRPKANLTRAEFVKLFYKILMTNVTVRAVNVKDADYDIVDPVVYTMIIGEKATFEAPKVPSRWILQGADIQTHVVEQGLEIVFRYRQQSTGGGGGNVDSAKYELIMLVDLNGDIMPITGSAIHAATGSGIYASGTKVDISIELEDEYKEGYRFIGWFEVDEDSLYEDGWYIDDLHEDGGLYEEGVKIFSGRTFTYTMPNKKTTLVARVSPIY